MIWKFLFLVVFAGSLLRAQDVQFLPEVDAHLTLNSHFRTYLEAKDDRDGGDPQQFTIGPSLQLYLKPLIKLKDFTSFDLNDSKKRAFVLETGYRYITAPGAVPESRMITAATLNFPLRMGFLMTDRNRADLDWKNGDFTWRYRNKLTIERTFAVHSYHFIPYIAAGHSLEPIQQMEHHGSLRRLSFPGWSTRGVQCLLRTRKRYWKASESAGQ